MIIKPTLLLDVKKCKKNIEAMFLKTQKHKIDFRPHFKTHQSLEIGSWFKELGVNKITVSSFDMASYFSSEWTDITVAFPVNILEIETINALAKKIQLNLLVESLDTINFLKENLKHEIGFFIKIDVGFNRTGILPTDYQRINKILNSVKPCNNISFKGFLAHAGHTYKCRTREEIELVHKSAIDFMSRLKTRFIEQYPNLIISLGDTPSCSVADNFSGVDEIRPGNFVFYDLTQNKIGSNKISQIAVALACPIVAIHKNRSEIVIYGGGVHLSKERLEDKEGIIFGRVAEQFDIGWGEVIPNMFVKSLSQEHGIVSVPKALIDKYKIGDSLIILPVHSCMTSNLMKSYKTLRQNDIVRL